MINNIPVNKRLHYFDGIRAMACLLILFHHSLTANLVNGLKNFNLPLAGYFLFNFTQSGVELFFLLSGILLMRPYLLEGKKMSLLEYYPRRFFRIYIPYFFAVIFAGFVIWINTEFPTWYSSTLIDYSIGGFIKQFFVFNIKQDYYNLAWWSLQIEVVFYILVPLFLIMCKNWKFYYAITITFIGSLFMQWITVVYLPNYYSLDYVIIGPVKIVDYWLCFIFGVFLAKERFEVSLAWKMILLGLLLQALSVYYMPLNNMSWAFTYFGVFVLVDQDEKIKLFFSSDIMVWIGERSYSLFLTHFSVFYLTNYLVSFLEEDRTMLYGILSRLLGIPFSFGVAMLLFYFIERKQARGLKTGGKFWPIL